MQHRFDDSLFWVFLIITFVFPWTCSVHLINRLFDGLPRPEKANDKVESPEDQDRRFLLSTFWQIWFTLFLAAFSMLMLMLATIAFAPEWKYQKGPHWGYYLLDGWAGVTLWPIHLVAACVFAFNLDRRFCETFSAVCFVDRAAIDFLFVRYRMRLL